MDNSDNDSEDDDSLTIKQIFNIGKGNFESDDEDNVPISQLIMNRTQGSRSDNLTSPKFPRRRLFKCGKSAQSDGTNKMKNSSDSVKKKYVQDEESEKDDSESGESDYSISDFIVDDTDVENAEDGLSEDSNQHSDEPEEASDDNVGFNEIISKLQRRRDPNSEWGLQGDMLSDFRKNPELCMLAVCAIYRRQVTKENLWVEGIHQVGRGFSKYDVGRGTILGQFLTDGNPYGDLVKTVEELLGRYPTGPEVCLSLACRYSNQLFKIYNNNEDPFFP